MMKVVGGPYASASSLLNMTVTLWHCFGRSICLCLPCGHCLKNTSLEQKWSDVNLVRSIWKQEKGAKCIHFVQTNKQTNPFAWNGAESIYSALDICKKIYSSFLNHPILTITYWGVREQGVSNCNVSNRCCTLLLCTYPLNPCPSHRRRKFCQ